MGSRSRPTRGLTASSILTPRNGPSADSCWRFMCMCMWVCADETLFIANSGFIKALHSSSAGNKDPDVESEEALKKSSRGRHRLGLKTRPIEE